MTFLLDTNVVSELRKAARNPHVTEWARHHAQDETFLSVITIQEIEVGILRRERHDPRQGGVLRTWLEDHVLKEYADQLLDVDVRVARRAAALQVPDPRPERDALIAATALVHGLTVVTRNTVDFEPMGVKHLNPWLPA